MKRAFTLLICFLIFCKLCSAQSGRSITVDFHQATIQQFASELESKSGHHFYYDPADFDSLRVTLQAAEKPLNNILNMAFKNTNYHFAIVEQQVFLTRDREIYADLPSGYYGNQSASVKVSATQQSFNDLTTSKAAKVPEATTENKTYEVGIKTNEVKSGLVTLAGYIRNVQTGEAIAGASIFVVNTKSGIATDQYGYYSLSLPHGRQTLLIRAAGMRDARRQLMLYSDGKVNINLQEQVTSLREVKISAEKVANVKSTTLGVNRLDIASIKQVPAVFGEADVLRVVLTLPGVQTVGEATTGFNVRGGSADQNLILLNDETIYNPAHFFGFFSAFDPDLVKDIQLYKSSIPEQYGGRLSSVLAVTDREGSKKNFTGSAGIGLITSRLSIEGPIVKDKTSFIFGGRTSYSDWLLGLLPAAYKHSEASFYDLNFNISHQIDEKNSLYLNSYMSHDQFKLNSDTAYKYNNRNINLKWKHNYNNKLYSVITAGMDHYDYDVSSNANPVNAYNLGFNINQTNLKADFTYYANRKNTVGFGISSIYYKIHPGTNEPEGSKSLVEPNKVPAEQAWESAVYLGDKYDITSALSLNLGLRYSLYNYLGAQTVRYYAPNLPRSNVNIADSVTYGKNKVINTYHGPEIRVSARYNLDDNTSVKAGYNTLRQYIHLLTNTTAISPIDVWKLSDPNIKPQYGDQVSLGLYHNMSSNTIETSVEVYYKRLRDYLDYKDGATLVLNHNIEQAVINTEGKAYGIEFFLKKMAGKLNGWMSYTYSRTFLKQNDPYAGQLINNGNYYPANFDKPHNFNFTGNYRFSHRYSVSLNVTYSTGRPITVPVATYEYAGAERVFYSDRNQYRIPDYFRSDFSINIEGNHKVHQKTHNSWTFGVYNVTGRQNAYSTYFTQTGGIISGYQLSIFAKPIPFVNYNIRF